MTINYQVRTGLVIGRAHKLSRINRQDTLRIDKCEHQDHVFGVIADGCGEGKMSEVGANLVSDFFINDLMKEYDENIDPDVYARSLYDRILSYLYIILKYAKFPDEPSRVNYIRDNLLFTLIGFVIGPKRTLVFASGDGVVIINNLTIFRVEDNQPDYLSYHLVDRKHLNHPSELPVTFNLYEIDTKSLSRLAVASDAWFLEKDLIDNELIWGFNHQFGLQRKMNVWSEKDHRFLDDASIITVEKRS